MSNFPTRRRVRTAALVAAPLTVLAFSLSACAPDHITSMDSPTPKSSDTARPASHEDAPAKASEAAQPSESASESKAAAPKDAASFLKAQGATYKVSSLTVDGAKVAPGTFSGVTVDGDAASDDGAQLTTLGLCSGTVFTVTAGSGDAYTFDAAGSDNMDKCADSSDEAVAKGLDKALSGDVDVAVSGNKITASGENGELVLTVAR